MEIDEIKKRLAEFEAKLKPITPDMLKPERLAKMKARRIRAERARQKEYEKIQKLKGKKILEGIAAAPGLAVGIVRNVHEQVPELMAQVKPGEVIVADRLRAEHDICMEKAAAFITNTGGMTCSTAIIARELHKPAVTGTMGCDEVATTVLHNGQEVVVDGTEGAVYMYAKTKSSRASQKKIHD